MHHLKLSLISALFLVSLSACVKVNILPEDSIQNGVDAGKNLIDQAKLARAGGKKRTLSTEVKLPTAAAQAQTEQACLSELKIRANVASTVRPFELVSEKTKFGSANGVEIIGCEMVIYVWN